MAEELARDVDTRVASDEPPRGGFWDALPLEEVRNAALRLATAVEYARAHSAPTAR